MIPKILHYCWFGRNPLSLLAKNCIESWKALCPDYQIVEWNEDNFDVNICTFAREAYAAKKWAFVSDYARLWILNKIGGIYMDTDVELVRNIDAFLYHHAFSGYEVSNIIPTGIIGAEAGNAWISYLLSYYKNRHFIRMTGRCDMTPNVIFMTKMTVEKYDLVPNNSFCDLGDVAFYPKEYFCPKMQGSAEILLTSNTYTIHHFNSSWVPMGKNEKRSEKSLRSRINNLKIRLSGRGIDI